MEKTPEPLDGTRTMRPPQSPLAPPAGLNEEYDELANSRGKRVSPQLICRAFRRHWLQALLLWGLGSVLLMGLAFDKVKPTYEATAAIRVEPGEQGIYARTINSTDFAEYKETQVILITSPIVL